MLEHLGDWKDNLGLPFGDSFSISEICPPGIAFGCNSSSRLFSKIIKKVGKRVDGL